MSIISLPTPTSLLPDPVRDPRVEPAARRDGNPVVEAPPPAGHCDCAPKAVSGAAPADLSTMVAAYLKARFAPITPIGPPPGDRRLLAEAGVDLARFARYPDRITPLGRSPQITSLAILRSPGSPEVLRAIWYRLSVARAMPEGITPLTQLLASKAGRGGAGKARMGVPASEWAAFADAMGETTLGNVFPAPRGRSDDLSRSAISACRCDAPVPRAGQSAGGG